jgi:hypothetical protein
MNANMHVYASRYVSFLDVSMFICALIHTYVYVCTYMHMYILPYLISYKRMTEQFFEDKINHHTSNLQVRVCMYAHAHT